jgi:hypothetical protein
MDQQIAIRPLLSSQALPAFWQSTSATGLVCRKEDRSDRDGPDDRAEGAGKGAGRRGHPQRLLEYRLALVRSLTRSAWKANLTFEAGAEELNGIADQSVDLAICIDAFEHMLDKRAVLASMYRKIGARFFLPDTGCRLRLVSDDSACVGIWHQASF